jgi:glutathione S-transferase
LLEELGVEDFEVCLLTPGQPYAAQMQNYGAQHSLKVPTLLMDGQEIGESSVISQIIAERYQNHRQLLGKPEERIEMLQWIAMAETCITFRIPLLPKLMGGSLDLSGLQAEIINPMEQTFTNNIARFESHFEERGTEYLLASGFSIADTMCGWSLQTFNAWGLMDLNAGASPKTLVYLKRLQARPAFKNTEKYAAVAPGVYGRECVPVSGEYS